MAANDDQRRVVELIGLVASCARRLAGQDYRTREDAGIERIFGEHYDAFMKVSGDEKTAEKTRAQIIANYVAWRKVYIRGLI